MDSGISDGGRHLVEPIYVARYNAFQRVNHWLTATLFVLLSLSGLSIFYPGLFFLSGLFGGGVAVRILHPWFGVALAASFFVLAAQFLVRNLGSMDDIRWMLRFRSVITNEHEGLPDLGKYNAGQKGVYWSQLFLIAILLVTGLAIWQVHFFTWTSIETQRIALLIHALAAALAMSIIIVHIYAGIWIKGTGRAMMRGTVTGGWAYMHHRKWLKEMLAARGHDGQEHGFETRRD
jgi:formate dehydrogenase subunit gamma